MEQLQLKLQSFERLVNNLPLDLPLHFTGNEIFGLDLEDIPDLGYAGAVNRCFELNWGMRANGIRIEERGDKLSTTLVILERALKEMPASADFGLIGIWLDTLIAAASIAIFACGSVQPSTSLPMNIGNSETADNTVFVGGRAAVHAASVASVAPSVTLTSEIPPPRSKPKPVNAAKLTQTKLSFKPISAEEYAEQERAVAEKLSAHIAHDLAKEKIRADKEAQMKRAYERDKKRLQRFRKRYNKFMDSTGVINIEDSDEEEEHSVSRIASASTSTQITSTQPMVAPVQHQELARYAWGAQNTSHRRDVKQKRIETAATAHGLIAPPLAPCRMNWQRYPYWLKITSAQTKLRSWSPTEIVQYLRKTDNELFAGLHVSTLACWIFMLTCTI
ncbi:hypothetical protein BD413DRAFT_543756 [Trametes elegans]|nr:hypothetical protein BD413DRAFT_543756 [Trametes elegans]